MPQYLEVEDQIFGPLTLKQFLFAAGGLGGAYAMWALVPSPFGIVLAILVGVFAGALGFGQMNGRPFLVMIESMVGYSLSRKLYLWRKKPKPVGEAAPEEAAAAPAVSVPRLSDSKLRDLGWGLDIQERLAGGPGPGHPDATPAGDRVPTIPPGII